MNSFLVFVSLLAIWPMSGAKKYPMTADTSIPAASGTVEVKKDKKNGNIQLDIKKSITLRNQRALPLRRTFISSGFGPVTRTLRKKEQSGSTKI